MPYLQEAIQSIFAQTLRDWELLAVDDASTDGSWEYLQSIDDPRVRLARNPRNMKQSFTQNRALEMSQAELIARMDADDISLPARLERQVSGLEANPEVDVLGCGAFRVDLDLKPISVRRPPTTHAEITRWASMNFPLTHGAMVGKTVWFAQWKADPAIRLCQDFDLLFRAHRSSTFGNISDPLYVYRYSGVTSTLFQKYCSVYYKLRSLVTNGFRMGIPWTTVLGIMSMLPRPPLHTIKHIVRSKTGLTRGQGLPLTEEDMCILQTGLQEVRRTEVPVKQRS